MRLTLRTLLAFRDGVLEPQDAAALEQKIKDSSTAQQISKRIEEGMRNRKLAPIPVDAREFGFEPNLVAEFLDDTIQVELLPEMERKCLENNALLSEIGSCHQILSRALSVPVSIPGSLRQRIRDLPNSPASVFAKSLETHGQLRRIDAVATVKPTESTANNHQAITPSGTLRKRNAELRTSGIELNDVLGKQVPEYLIGSDRGWWKRGLVAASLLVALISVGAIAIGPLERVRELLDRSAPLANAGNGVKREETRTVDREDAAKSVGKVDDSDSKLGPNAPALAADPATLNREPDSTNNEIPPDVTPRKTPDTNSIDQPTIAASPSSQIKWMPEDKASGDSIVLIGNSVTDGTKLAWRRMQSGEAVTVSQRILVPPAQRTELRVGAGIRWLCAGENDLEPLANGAVSLKAGRAILFPTPDAQSLIVDCNGMQISIRFRTLESSCALEVLNRLVPVDDASLDAGSVSVSQTVRLLGVQNEVEYSTQAPQQKATTGTLNVGQYQTWNDGSAAPAHRELSEAPWWLRSSYERGIDRLAAEDLNRALAKADASEIESELIKLTQARRAENAAMAIRFCILLGRYEGLVASDGALNRKELYSHWDYIIDQISQSLGRNENREKFVEALRAQTAGRFSTVLGLLIPKSQAQLENGSDKLLVEGLSSPNLDERVLAIHQLAKITGKNLGFHPDKNSVDSLQAWRKLLGRGEVRYVETPTP
jgi:hypothetical protein